MHSFAGLKILNQMKFQWLWMKFGLQRLQGFYAKKIKNVGPETSPAESHNFKRPFIGLMGTEPNLNQRH